MFFSKKVDSTKQNRFSNFQEQQSHCTGKIQQTTGLIEFCIEALKEKDSAAFLQVGPMLINRANSDITWYQEVTNSPRTAVTLDDSQVIQAIQSWGNFKEFKRKFNHSTMGPRTTKSLSLEHFHAAAKEGEERIPTGEIRKIL